MSVFSHEPTLYTPACFSSIARLYVCSIYTIAHTKHHLFFLYVYNMYLQQSEDYFHLLVCVYYVDAVAAAAATVIMCPLYVF